MRMRAEWILIGLELLLAGGCVSARSAKLPQQNALLREQLIIHSDFGIAHHHRLVDELVARREDLVNLLKLPASDEPIHCFLFDSAAAYQDFVTGHYPGLPHRRALFVETDTRLTVYAYWGDHVAEDLRHEITHGYLHTMVPHIPLWIDEGLAEYSEVPRGHHGLNRPHLVLLLDGLERQEWQPNMYRLEQIESAADMTQLDYAEAWAWMHWLLESTPEHRQLLQNHLARIRLAGSAAPLSEVTLVSDPRANQDLVNHLRGFVTNK